MNLDLLAIAAHPDDVELSCGGTMLRMATDCAGMKKDETQLSANRIP